MTGSAEPTGEHPGLSRRGFLGLVGLGGGGVAAGYLARGAQDAGARDAGAQRDGGSEDEIFDFFGEHQAGIITPQQNQMHFASFTVNEETGRDQLIELLRDWTYAANRMSMGLDVTVAGAFGGGTYLPPEDTGEARGFGAAGLTLTFGMGPSLFRDERDRDRFGIAHAMPEEFTSLPKMVNDFMDPARSGGDLCVQACAHDPQVAVHAIRNLTRIAMGRATLKWAQLGFGRSSSTSVEQQTPRNLFGQKDGTNNLKAEQPEELEEHVWIPPSSSAPALAGGTYLIARRISMGIEVWDGVQLGEQERVTGRNKDEGAPLSGGEEFTAPDFTAKDEKGALLIDKRSHLARVHPDFNDGIAMLRRGYNFVDGNDAQGRLDAGLFFIAFVREPGRFARVHKNMARDDMFIEYLKTTGSAVFLVPPGISDGQYLGHQVFGD
ncbi:Dyp-type peroxidase [Corynebacterium pacaense]|uniref:Dyp-type peroxidase n=1 Tax=Corynebacterium pacaense TaxID=1816684 RepID=UPI0009B9BB90|nr:Dyp-type peroxidase [Corynebacterium pacaense]